MKLKLCSIASLVRCRPLLRDAPWVRDAMAALRQANAIYQLTERNIWIKRPR